MKIAGIERRNKPNCIVLWKMQDYSTRGWVYREEQGWIFAELMSDELSDFKSYKCGSITTPRMRVRLPYSPVWGFIGPDPERLDNFANWFAYCTIPQAYPLLQSRFHLHQIADEKPISDVWHSSEPGSYETWLWADEVQVCRESGCEVAVQDGWGWKEWGVPPEWKAPLQYKERIIIYAFVNELNQEVYVVQTEKLERRWIEHLRDTKNSGKMALIQSLCAQGREPKPIKADRKGN